MKEINHFIGAAERTAVFTEVDSRWKVYRHRRIDKNEIFYIGIGTRRRPYDKSKRSKLWKNITAKTKYEVEILYSNLSQEEACELEMFLISLYGRRDLGKGTLVNLTDGGEGVAGYMWSDTQRLNASLLRKGLLVGNKNPMFGKNGELNPNYGNYWSEEQKQKASEVQKNVNRSGGSNGRARKCINILTNQIFDSRIEAAEYMGLEKQYLLNRINGNIFNDTSIMFLDDFQLGRKVNYNCTKNCKYRLVFDVKNNCIKTLKNISKEILINSDYLCKLINENKISNFIYCDNYVINLIGEVRDVNGNIYKSLNEFSHKTGICKHLCLSTFIEGKYLQKLNITYNFTYFL